MPGITSFPRKVLIFGDSFISRMATFLRENEATANSKYVDPTLYGCMGMENCDLRVWGHERMNAAALVQHYQVTGYDFLEGFRPDVVIMHLGGNDLYNDTENPDATVKAIRELVQLLCDDFEVKTVVVCPVLPRKFPQRKAHLYMASLRKVNEDIKQLSKILKGCKYWSHKRSLRLWNADLYGKDGINFSSKGSGKTIFCRSIREAVVKARMGAL